MASSPIIRFITHGGPFHETTRWHRVKCTVRHTYYPLKGRIIDWWTGETYVPLFCRVRGEMRAVRSSSVKDLLTPANFALPRGWERVEDLPHFTTSDACFAHISETWPHLEP